MCLAMNLHGFGEIGVDSESGCLQRRPRQREFVLIGLGGFAHHPQRRKDTEGKQVQGDGTPADANVNAVARSIVSIGRKDRSTLMETVWIDETEQRHANDAREAMSTTNDGAALFVASRKDQRQIMRGKHALRGDESAMRFAGNKYFVVWPAWPDQEGRGSG